MKQEVTEGLRSWVEVDGAALRHNFTLLHKASGRAAMIPAIKANAYGHGFRLVAQELSQEAVGWWGLANAAEAASARAAGLRGPILLFSAALPEEMDVCIEMGCEPMISSFEELMAWGQAAVRVGIRLPVHLKVDTGMGRLGSWWQEASALLEGILRVPSLVLRGVATHFACAEEDRSFTQLQWERLQAVLRASPVEAILHASNSAAILHYPEIRADAVRPGIALYGCEPIPSRPVGLRPVLSWKARITAIRDFLPGRTISYGATFYTTRKTRVAILAVGYADGYSRRFSNLAWVLMGGHKCRVLGRVTMDQTMVELPASLDVRVGDPATLLGEGLSVEQLAAWDQTITYEIFTGIGARVTRLALPEAPSVAGRKKDVSSAASPKKRRA